MFRLSKFPPAVMTSFIATTVIAILVCKMKIYPNLDYHFLVTASLEERVRRKCIQYNGKVPEDEVKQNIIKRDELQEKTGFYQKYDKTILVDITSCKTVEESTKEVLKYITQK